MDQSTQAALADLVNKADITSVVNSYFRSLDEKNFDAQHFATFLTTDARMTRPNGASLVGPEEISASHRQSFARFEGTQHFLTTPDISLEGESAAVRANLMPCTCGKAVTPTRTISITSLSRAVSSAPG